MNAHDQDPACPSASSKTGHVTLFRVYSNGDHVQKTLPANEVDDEVDYSRRYRPGCALFVGPKCVQTGYLGKERCDAISQKIASSGQP
jgi:hypothetical protein